MQGGASYIAHLGRHPEGGGGGPEGMGDKHPVYHFHLVHIAQICTTWGTTERDSLTDRKCDIVMEASNPMLLYINR
jgi:hypothetical protein